MALTKVQNTGIADDAITTDKIENSTVVAADLAASSVTNAKIATGTIGNAKLTNSSITVNGSSISLGGSGSVKHIDWQAVTVADGSTQLTAEAGKGYFLDTNTGVIEVFLPSSPSRGDTIVLVDYGGTFATNKAIVNTGGKLIDSTEGPDFKLTTNNTIADTTHAIHIIISYALQNDCPHLFDLCQFVKISYHIINHLPFTYLAIHSSKTYRTCC